MRLGWSTEHRGESIRKLLAVQAQLNNISFEGKTDEELFGAFDRIDEALHQSKQMIKQLIKDDEGYYASLFQIIRTSGYPMDRFDERNRRRQ